MECAVKYGTWNVKERSAAAEAALRRSGYGPLTAAVLAARGYDTPEKARSFLLADGPLEDPLPPGHGQGRRADSPRLAQGEAIAVFGDYDVDGITATCLLTEFLQSQGGNVTTISRPASRRATASTRRHRLAPGPRRLADRHRGLRHHRRRGGRLLPGAGHRPHHHRPPRVPRRAAAGGGRGGSPPQGSAGPTRCLAGVGVAFKLAAASWGARRPFCSGLPTSSAWAPWRTSCP